MPVDLVIPSWCLAVLAATAVLSAVATWIVLRVARAIGARQVVRDDGPQSHLGKQGTPSLGGIGFIAAFVIAVVAVLFVGRADAGILWHILPVLAACVLFGLIGFYDDFCKFALGRREGWKARYRIVAQVLVAALVACLWLQRPHMPWMFGFAGLGETAWRVLAAFVLVGSVNAVNFSDGLDGLAAGLAAICAVGLGFATMITGDTVLPAVAFALAGACLGFLWLNGHPASIFMGDVGSYGLGAALAAIALVAGIELLYALMGFVFVAEALSVIGQVISFRTTGKRILKMAPLHHHFELCGWPETKVVVRFHIVGILFAIVGLCGLASAVR